MKTIYSGTCTCGHTTSHFWQNRLTGEWARGYYGECTGTTDDGDTCHRSIYLRCHVTDDDLQQAA